MNKTLMVPWGLGKKSYRKQGYEVRMSFDLTLSMWQTGVGGGLSVIQHHELT